MIYVGPTLQSRIAMFPLRSIQETGDSALHLRLVLVQFGGGQRYALALAAEHVESALHAIGIVPSCVIAMNFQSA